MLFKRKEGGYLKTFKLKKKFVKNTAIGLALICDCHVSSVRLTYIQRHSVPDFDELQNMKLVNFEILIAVL